MTTKMPWFRMYTDAVDDEKLRLLAPSDRWYFFAILCCKGKDIIDDGGPLLKRKVAVKLGLQVDELEEVVRRLAEVGLVDRETLQPLGWEGRQFKSDGDSTATERKRRQRERAREVDDEPAESVQDESCHAPVTRDTERDIRDSHAHVTRTDTDTDTEADTEEEKNKNRTQTRKRAADVSQGKKNTATQDQPDKPIDVGALVAEGVAKQHAHDWLRIRKVKRLPLTATAWDAIKKEASLAALSPGQAVKKAVTEGWAGFKASWITADNVARKGGMLAPDPEWYLSIEGIMRRGDELSVERQRAGEQFVHYKARVFKAAGNGPWIQKLLAEWRGTETVHAQLLEFFNDIQVDGVPA